MPDSIAVLSLLDRVTDASGDVLPGATLSFYEAGTTTPKTVYADANLTTSLGSVVTCDSGGYPSSNGTAVSIYTGTDSYKVVVKDADNATVLTRDNVRGASSIPTSSSVALPQTPVVSKTSNYTVVSGDRAKLINADPTGGSFAVTLPSAATVGDGWRVGVRHSGASTTNVVTVRTTSSQTIGAPGQSSITSLSLVGLGQTAWFVSNGTGWSIDGHAPPFVAHGIPLVIVEDRIATPPANPVGGQRYLINGTPTGVWATLGYLNEDIVESNGNGGWMKYRPKAGWLAYVRDEQLYTHFDGANWIDLENVTAPTSSVLGYLSVNDTKATNTAGGTATTGSWAARTLNTSVVNTITGASLATNQITLPAGKYLVTARGSFYRTGNTQMRLRSTTTSTEIVSPNVSMTYYIDGAVTIGIGGEVVLSGVLNLSAEEKFELQYYCSRTQASDGLGVARNVGSESEVYAEVTIVDLTAVQGPRGEQGPQGGTVLPRGALTLANGANSDIAIGTNLFHEITGPTGAFSVSGFVAADPGTMLVVYNTTAQNMTITNDATSTAANRILTLTGADVTLTGTSSATFIYSQTASRWVLIATRD